MNAFLIYILELNVYLTIFAAAFLLLYKNAPYHRFNRGLILSSVIISAILPFLSFGTAGETVLTTIALDPVLITEKAVVAQTPIGSNLPSLFTSIYFIGFAISMIIFIWQAYRLKNLLKGTKHHKKSGVIECTRHDLKSPSSFFNTIIWSGNLDAHSREFIEDHELVHIREKHSIDLIFLRFFKAVCWFNPFIYFLHQSLEAAHEFRADEVVAQKHGDTNTYSKIILSQAMDVSPNILVHQFSKSKLLKRRIMMLNNQSRSKFSSGRYFLLIPILAVALILNACTDEQADVPKALEQKIESSKKEGTDVYSTASVMPEFPGGQDAMMAYLGENIVYPESCKEEGVEGTVFVSFVIDTEGKVGDIKIARSPDDRLSANAIDVVASMPDWTPGNQDGTPVKIQYSLPIRYQLD